MLVGRVYYHRGSANTRSRWRWSRTTKSGFLQDRRAPLSAGTLETATTSPALQAVRKTACRQPQDRFTPRDTLVRSAAKSLDQISSARSARVRLPV